MNEWIKFKIKKNYIKNILKINKIKFKLKKKTFI